MGMEVEAVADGNGMEDSVSPIKQAIVRALMAASEHDTTEYDKLLLEWRDLRIEDPESNTFLECRLKALSQAVSYIKERDHEELLSYVLGMSLWMHSPEVSNSLAEFLINLAFVNGGCLIQCLDMLVRNFLPPSSGLPIFIDFFSRRAIMKGMPKEILMQRKSEHMGRKDSTMHCLHMALRKISELVPITVMHLRNIVLQRMPHRIVDKEWNALYMENMLRLEQDAKGDYIQNQMLLAVVDRLIQIDVEIRWEDIVKEDDSSKIFVLDMEFDELLDDVEANIGPGSEAQQLAGVVRDSDGERRLSLCAVADKMDILMDMTLQHLQKCVEAGRIEQVFSTLMASFQSTILDTYKSKFTQFLIFYVCSLSPSTVGDKFTSLLCEILTSPNRAPNTRMSAAAYLASFLARAKYLPLNIISSSLKRVVSWCISYTPRQIETKGALTVDAGVHGVLYSACQAVMYVLCFRMKTLLDDLDAREMLYKLPLDDLLRHSLNPLKLCLRSVVDEFLKQATAAHLVNANLSSEVNRNIDALELNTFGGINRLDMFFPFDPYLLRQSDRFIRPNFIFWSMVQCPEDELSDSDIEGNENEGEGLIASEAKGKLFRESFERPGSVELHSMEDNDSVTEDEDDLEGFEISMNRMSLTPGDLVPSHFMRARALKSPLPLPAKLTPEVLQRYSNSFC
ncbi:hypothetical protein GOP47_0017759 [Adiantum capillus-veneris]|uniref:RNA polymerase I-specific transcription initiation factor RRN3 n=1 Tax=Adiantum capillus-veneris TaxID=13818 RepID=A0A9D4UH56_ADICA|nr:hypothetical protein GOP47_0017759 [Adiantum capillus-veneris]